MAAVKQASTEHTVNIFYPGVQQHYETRVRLKGPEAKMANSTNIHMALNAYRRCMTMMSKAAKGGNSAVPQPTLIKARNDLNRMLKIAGLTISKIEY